MRSNCLNETPKTSDLGETGERKMTRQQSLKERRKTALASPMLADMARRSKLQMKNGEAQGTLSFRVDKTNLLRLSPSDVVRTTLLRRIEGLSAGQIDDDSSYYDTVNSQAQANVTIVLPVPAGRGWRCHALVEGQECLHPNLLADQTCNACSAVLPKLKPEFQHLRILSHSIRSQSKEYIRIIRKADLEITICETAEEEARKRLEAAGERQVGMDGDAVPSADSDDEDEELMMNVELQSGAWQRVHANTVVSTMKQRKAKSLYMLNAAKAELAIMIQSSYELAAHHSQKIVRGFLVRASINRIKQEAAELAEFSAAVDIQRIIRSSLASMKKLRLRKLRQNLMATRIQCMFRKRVACLEKTRLWSIWFEERQRHGAIKIQSVCRGHLCKLRARQLADEQNHQLEEQEKARQANQENDAATLIQSHARRRISAARCANRLVELGLHERLLIYIERFTVDGNFFDLVSSINKDYMHFERTITSTIEREEKLAKTFVEKVVRLRDVDHSNAWEKYLQREDAASSEQMGPHAQQHHTTQDKSFVTPASVMKKLYQNDRERRHPKLHDGHGWEQTRDFSATKKLYGSRRRMTSQHPHTKNNRRPKVVRTPKTLSIETSISSPKADVGDEASADSIGEQHLDHAKRLIELNKMKDRLRGHYTRFDIPNGLDDTTVRFVTAVAMRYNFICPQSSTLRNDSFAYEIQQDESLTFAESLIQQLHAQGFVFIRQLLPMDHMAQVLSSLEAPEEFVVLACQLIVVLRQMTGGNYMSRRYLMTECEQFLSTQKALSKSLTSNKRRSAIGEVTYRLGEFIASDEIDNDDVLGGLWASTEIKDLDCSNTNSLNTEHQRTLTESKTTKHQSSGRPKSWAVAYTKKVLDSIDHRYPAYFQYRHGTLLARKN